MPKLWQVNEATEKLQLIAGHGVKPAAGDYVISRGELCRLSIGRNGRLPIVPLVPDDLPVALSLMKQAAPRG